MMTRKGSLGEFEVKVHYMTVNDGGELRALVWEQGPDQPFPDLVVDRAVEHERYTQHLADKYITDSLTSMMRSSVKCESCED